MSQSLPQTDEFSSAIDEERMKSTPSRGSHLIGAIDQGTTSTRFMIFSLLTGELVTYHQLQVERRFPHDGWVEQEPEEIYQSVITCIDKAVHNLESMGQYNRHDIAAIGITNQRETSIAWDKETGKSLYRAIVWSDNRTALLKTELVRRTRCKTELAFQKICGLPLSTYFSALKLRWLLDEIEEVRNAAKERTLHVGTVDTWLLWKLTQGQVYATDVTNASRTMLMNLHRLQWDPEMCKFFRIDISMLPKIRSSAEHYGNVTVPCALQGVPITGILGDQQAALVGQGCIRKGMVKNTYGTGCFLLCHTGDEPVFSEHGLLTTVAYQLGPKAPVCYALEGSVAASGATMTWLRDNLQLYSSSEEIETIARSVPDTAGCYIVPAFSGLLCPHWRSDARGVIVGLSYNTRAPHLVRAGLEAVCFQSCELLDSMRSDLKRLYKSVSGGSVAPGSGTGKLRQTYETVLKCMKPSENSVVSHIIQESSSEEEGEDVMATPDTEYESEYLASPSSTCQQRAIRLTHLRVDGGMVCNDLLLQLQADLSGLPVERPIIMETTSVGAAIAAAYGAGLNPHALANRVADTFLPCIEQCVRQKRLTCWSAAIQRSYGWVQATGEGISTNDDSKTDFNDEQEKSDLGSTKKSKLWRLICMYTTTSLVFSLGVLVGAFVVGKRLNR